MTQEVLQSIVSHPLDHHLARSLSNDLFSVLACLQHGFPCGGLDQVRDADLGHSVADHLAIVDVDVSDAGDELFDSIARVDGAATDFSRRVCHGR